MKDETKSVTFINYSYKLIEMDDEITKSIENIDAVIAQQNELVKVIQKHPEDSKKFEFFIKSLNEQTSNLEQQKNVMQYRQDCLKQVLNVCAANEMSAYVVSMLLEGLGLENKEAKSIEERKEEISKLENK